MSEPLFAIIARDAADTADARAKHREGHLAHFKAHADMIAVAGPLSGAGSGSLVIYRAANEDQARAFIEADPFNVAGVWDEIEIFAFRAGAGDWVPRD